MTAAVQEGFIRVDFAGPGGTSMGLRLLGLDSVGVEYEASAVATARAAGFKRWLADVTSSEVRSYPWNLWGYCASPECQSFSLAGKGEGRAALAHLAEAAYLVASGATPEDAVSLVRDEALSKSATLSLEPLLVIRDHRPRWVALEQVPGVLPLWEVYAEILRGWGYSVDFGILNAEQYGVPQTRKRAILMASLDRVAMLPKPTHSRYYSRTPAKLDDGVQKWVSMAEALGWAPSSLVGFPRRSDGRGEDIEMDGVAYRARDLRPASDPAQTITEKARSFQRFDAMGDVRSSRGTIRSIDEPAPTITSSMDNGNFQFTTLEAVERMGAGMVERHGDRPGRPIDAPAFTIRANAGGMEPGGFVWSDAEQVEALREQGRVQLRNNTSENAGVRDESEPAPTMYFGARLNKMVWEPSERAAVAAIVEPRVNNQSGTEFDLAWPLDRPAPVVAGRELITMPGANANRFNGSTKSRNDGVRVTAAEAGILQSMPADYPWQGTKTQQFQQVGNMVPALLQAAIVHALLTGPSITTRLKLSTS